MQEKKKPSKWIVYILLCKDGSYYTGITNNLEKRLEAHNSGRGAKYTRSRTPVNVVFTKTAKTKGLALKKELKIKKMKRIDKEKLIRK